MSDSHLHAPPPPHTHIAPACVSRVGIYRCICYLCIVIVLGKTIRKIIYHGKQGRTMLNNRLQEKTALVSPTGCIHLGYSWELLDQKSKSSLFIQAWFVVTGNFIVLGYGTKVVARSRMLLSVYEDLMFRLCFQTLVPKLPPVTYPYRILVFFAIYYLSFDM